MLLRLSFDVLQMWMSARTRGCAPGVIAGTPRAPSSVAVTPASQPHPLGTTVMVRPTQTHTHTGVHAHARMHTHACTRTQGLCTRTQLWIQVRAHAYAHTEVNTHAHIQDSAFVAC